MATRDATTWEHVRDERVEILALLRGLQDREWDRESLCEGWRVRDVAAHLLVDAPVRELGPARVLTKMARWRFDVHQANAWWVANNADRPVATIVDRFEQSLTPSWLSRRLGAANQLRAAVIHHQDIRRPLGQPRTIPPARLRAVLDVLLTGPGTVNLGSRERAKGLRLQATDLDWARGEGRAVLGTGEALLMSLAGRSAAFTELAGPGVGQLVDQDRAVRCDA